MQGVNTRAADAALPGVFHALYPAQFNDVERFDICHSASAASRDVTLELLLGRAEDQRKKFKLRFSGVCNLRIAAPEGQVSRISRLAIGTVEELGGGEVRYVVTDLEQDVISFVCQDFDVAIVEQDAAAA